MILHEEILQGAQPEALRMMARSVTEQGFYLAGGTALALQLGHRRSVDFDWFTDGFLHDPILLAQQLRDEHVPFETSSTERGTLHGAIAGVRVTFLEYRYPLLQPPIFSAELGCRLAGLEDIACMKLSALAQRGSRKDFIDIYALFRTGLTLGSTLNEYRRKYAVKDIAHVLYGLAYFDDAEREEPPYMVWDLDWKEVKKTIQKRISEFSEK
ncbi:MAG: nucleotidyl transferase AbiEii/AbiGii toxin family protein [Thermodesulfobacteriota bacterium]